MKSVFKFVTRTIKLYFWIFASANLETSALTVGGALWFGQLQSRCLCRAIAYLSSFDTDADIRRALRTCGSLEEGQKIHAIVLKKGQSTPPISFIHNALLHMYAKHDQILAVSQAFDLIPYSHKDVVDWTTLIACFSRNGFPCEALRIFRAMQAQGVSPDAVTVVALLGSCALLLDDAIGTCVHQIVIKTGMPFTVTARNAAMDVYAKCGRMDYARCIFNEMMTSEDPDSSPSIVSWTIILAGMIKWEGPSVSRNFFDKMPEKNEVAFTVMIAAYVEGGNSKEALVLLSKFLSSELNTFHSGLNYITIVSILSACSQTGDMAFGRLLHVYAMKMADPMHLMINTALVDMYGKCGLVDCARIIFYRMPKKNVVAWNAMLSGLAMHGRGLEVLNLFHQMTTTKMNPMITPDDVTLVAVLSACSHSGLVEQGWQYFQSLEPVYGITPKMEHYACMVDLLGRAGMLNEAEALVRRMPVPPNEVVFGSLLASCSLHNDFQLVEKLMGQMTLQHQATQHVLLSNIYSLSGKWDKGDALRRASKQIGIQKSPGMSYIRMHNGQVHQFYAGDRSHSRSLEVYLMLEEINGHLRLAGYVPNASSQSSCLLPSLTDLEEEREEREQMLLYHSERLAVAFGLLNTRLGMPLHIFKNLRICKDCHSAVKFISKIYEREIIIRDRYRFHHFKEGHCTCSDYW